jgi:hypothetical protein
MTVDEMFWKDVMEAYQQITVNHEREITVARNGKEAEVYYVPSNIVEGVEASIVIEIREVETETKDPLPVPVGRH